MIFLVLQVVFYGAEGQNLNFSRLNSNDGLSSNTIYDILKDHSGLMWFATEDGLNRFDGSHYAVYRNHPDDSSSLQANEVLALHEDKAGNLWVGTGGGSLSLYDRKLDRFIHFKAKDTPGFIRNNVIKSIESDFTGRIWVATFNGVNIVDPRTMQVSDFLFNGRDPFKITTLCLFEDSKQRMWIGTDEGLFLYNPKDRMFSRFVQNPDDPSSIISNSISTITEDKSGNIWIGTGAGLSMKETAGSGFVNHKYHPGNESIISNNQINALSVDGKGNLWIGSDGGIEIIDFRGGSVKKIPFNERFGQGLSGTSVLSVYFDQEGICWIGTYRGGINKYDPNLNLFNLVRSNPFDAKSLPAPIVKSFAEAKNGEIFVGTENGGVSLFSPATRSFRHYTIRSNRAGAGEKLVVMALLRTQKNKLLVGTFGDGIFILDPVSGSYRQVLQAPVTNRPGSDQVFTLSEDKSGNIWIGTNGDGISLWNQNLELIKWYTPAPKVAGEVLLPMNGYIRDITEDNMGQIWFATHGGGIAKLDPHNEKFTIFNFLNSRLPSDKVQSLFEDRKGNMWVATFGGGLGLLDKKSGNFITFAEKHGLANNNIHKIVEDDLGKLWLSTDQGLSSFDPEIKKFNNYNAHNGLQHRNFVHGAGLKARSGDLYFGGIEGFNYFNPRYLVKNKTVPRVIFTELKIANKLISPTEDGAITENISVSKEINLDYKQNFTLGFVALNYSAPEQNQYAYKLEGFDDKWSYVGNTNSVSYTNLDPGEYVLRVKASNNDGVWNEEGSSIRIFVHPPFWRTNFAYLLYAGLIAGGLLYMRYKGIQKMKLKFKREQELMEAEQEKREAERLHELDQLKIKFLTNLSHEFRTPISLILGPIDTLIRKVEDKGAFGQLNMIKRNARRLLNLVNQLLDFRKMEEQELKLHLAEGELVAFVREVADSFRDISERKKIEFVFSSGLGELHTRFDHDKIERILFNLLSNAFKFTFEGGTISLVLEIIENREEPFTTWVSFKVNDTGIGIAEEQKEKIFERFFQSNTATSILNQGTGIGLSITREFVKMQGGEILVESEPGKGSSFIVQLPFNTGAAPKGMTGLGGQECRENIQLSNAEQAEETYPAAPPVSVQESIEMPAILLVEDNEDFRFYLKDNLRLYYKVYEASNGKEGWQKALALHPQIIVSDISMPFMDGIELCKKIKGDKRTHHIPVILLTALSGEGDQLRGLEIGANDYIIKPFNFMMLNAKLNNLLTLNITLKSTYTKQINVLASEVAVESEDERLMKEIMLFVEENMTDLQLSVEALSRHVGMSRSSLYSKLLEMTGQTPVEFIRSVKLNKAAALLERTDMNIAQVAYSVGFTTPNYFAKSFKAKFGMLPSEYATKMRNGSK